MPSHILLNNEIAWTLRMDISRIDSFIAEGDNPDSGHCQSMSAEKRTVKYALHVSAYPSSPSIRIAHLPASAHISLSIMPAISGDSATPPAAKTDLQGLELAEHHFGPLLRPTRATQSAWTNYSINRPPNQ